MRISTAVLAILAAAAVCHGRTITVDDDGPADFNNIQAAIDDANDGDTVIVSEGRYYENINFSGKNIVLRSTDPTDSAVVEATIIEAGYFDSVVMFSGTETANCVLSGCMITGGIGHRDHAGRRGGGIYGNGTLATIEHNVISGNMALPDIAPGGGLGGGIYDCDGVIEHNVITNNDAVGMLEEVAGGGLYGCDGLIQHNVIANNTSEEHGGGLANCQAIIAQNIIAENRAYYNRGGGLFACNGYVKANTIYGNTSDYGGGGLHYCRGIISNSIVWQNSPTQIENSSLPAYSCIQDWTGGGTGITTADPCFVDAGGGNFHLRSQAGRWDPNSESWLMDAVTSPCIDAGDPMSPLGFEPFPNGGIVNMGAYAGTAEASKSYFGGAPCETIVAGDVNGDCRIDFLDFQIMALHWMEGG